MQLVAAALCALLHIVCVAQSRPPDFTAQERAQFTERSASQRRVELPLVAHHGGAAGWLDARRVLYSTREVVGVWKAGLGEPARLVVFDVDTRTVSETPYRGNLVCAAGGRILVSQPVDPARSGFSRGLGDVLLAAEFGQELVPVGDIRGREIAAHDCSLTPKSFGGRGDPEEIPLRQDDGRLHIPRRDGGAGYELRDAAGRLVATYSGTGAPLPGYLHFVPWLHAYFSDKGTRGASELFWPDGRRSIVLPPPLLTAFAQSHEVGSAVAAPSRAGVLWGVVTWRGYWRMQGIYLASDSRQLARIDDAHVPGQPRLAVSDDGCRVFYFRRRGDPLDGRVPLVPTVMDVCEEEKK